MAKQKLLKDPAGLASQIDLKRSAPELKLALGLDLGTTTGLAYTWFDPRAAWCPQFRPIYLGQLDLSVGDYDSGVIRFVRMREFLHVLDPDLVGFEDVSYTAAKENFGPHPTVHQVIARVARPIELFGSFKATLGTWCEERGVPCVGYRIQAIKKRATGLGNANKLQVIEAANAEFAVGLEAENYEQLGSDNMADALFCLALVLEQYSHGVTPHAQEPEAAAAPPLSEAQAALARIRAQYD